jgi:hypothetical protein
MAREDKYPRDQWLSMTTPEMQASIQRKLFTTLGLFLDTAPEGEEWERVKEVLNKLQQYIAKEYDDPASNIDKSEAEQVMASLSAARERITKCLDMSRAEMRKPPTPEKTWTPEELEKATKEYEQFEQLLSKMGKKHWWD